MYDLFYKVALGLCSNIEFEKQHYNFMLYTLINSIVSKVTNIIDLFCELII